MDHFSGNPQAGCRVTYPISRLLGHVDSICECWPTYQYRSDGRANFGSSRISLAVCNKHQVRVATSPFPAM